MRVSGLMSPIAAAHPAAEPVAFLSFQFTR
jgi:hypothetical protein